MNFGLVLMLISALWLVALCVFNVGFFKVNLRLRPDVLVDSNVPFDQARTITASRTQRDGTCEVSGVFYNQPGAVRQRLIIIPNLGDDVAPLKVKLENGKSVPDGYDTRCLSLPEPDMDGMVYQLPKGTRVVRVAFDGRELRIVYKRANWRGFESVWSSSFLFLMPAEPKADDGVF